MHADRGAGTLLTAGQRAGRDQAATVIAHEWIELMGGSENVVADMVSALPGSRLECLWNNAPNRFPDAHESFLARTMLRDRKAASLPLMRQAWNQVDLNGVDRVIASSHAMAHHVAGRAAKLGLDAYAYVHSPARYLWNPEIDLRGTSTAGALARPFLKGIDRKGVDPRVSYAANSRFVADRIRQVWGVDARVIHPAVDTETIQAVDAWESRLERAEVARFQALPKEFVLGASRLIAYKRLDVPIAVGERLGLPVVIAGTGAYAAELRRRAASASVPVIFVGSVSDAGLYTLFQRTSLYVFMAIEDFGIMPIEAMALGAPCLVRDVGGARETMELLGMSSYADPDDGPALTAAAVAAIDAGPVDRRTVAAAFSHAKFEQEFLSWVGA